MQIGEKANLQLMTLLPFFIIDFPAGQGLERKGDSEEAQDDRVLPKEFHGATAGAEDRIPARPCGLVLPGPESPVE